MATTKPYTTSDLDGFRVALNPRNPEANSWYNPETGVNLFLAPRKDEKGKEVKDTGPISADLSDLDHQALAPVYDAIRHGILIVASGEMPETIKRSELNLYGSPRSRWDPDLVEKQKSALKHFDSLVHSMTEKQAQKHAEKTAEKAVKATV